jgi:hypothetical protein
MSRHALSPAFVLFALALSVPAAQAQMPERLTFQGRLTNGAGNPVEGSVDLTFRLYTAESGGSLVWTEVKSAVPVSGGLYGVLLGGAGWGTADFSAPYWMSVQAGTGGEMAPRYPLSASPYAMRAKVAESALSISGFDPSLTWKLSGNAGTTPGTSFLGTTDSVGLAFKTNNQEAVRISPERRVGIGTAAPGEKLHVQDGNVLLMGDGEQAIRMVRTGLANNPCFSMGRMLVAGGNPELRFVYQDDLTPERSVFEFDSTGIVASVKPARGSHFEGFIAGDIQPLFRLNSFPSMQLELGPGGAALTDVHLRRETDAAFTLHVGGARALRIEPTEASNAPNIIGGYPGNGVAASTWGATISGGGSDGEVNTVTGDYGSIGGGAWNTANSYDTIGGGEENAASGNWSTIGGGLGNTINGLGTYSVIGGGRDNTASQMYAAIGGGDGNVASGMASVVAGGSGNSASGLCSMVVGGIGSIAAGNYSFASGLNAQANHLGAFVWADSTNHPVSSTQNNEFTARATGGFRLITYVYPSTGVPMKGITIAAGTNALDTISNSIGETLELRARGLKGLEVIPGGILFPDGTQQMTAAVFGTSWSLSGNTGTSPTANFIGTMDNVALNLRVNNVRALRLEPNATSPNLIGGYFENAVSAGIYGATIGGGGLSKYTNRVSGNYGTVSGGGNNVAGSVSATVGGGESNAASSSYATVGGGLTNAASGSAATIGGGDNNSASGNFATVAGGRYNTASGLFGFAAGNRAKTQTSQGGVHDGAFVWADSGNFDFYSTAPNEFSARATGGVRFVTAIDGAGAPTRTFSIDGAGNVYAAGVVSGDGSGLAGLWRLGGNAGTDPATQFLGTTDSQALNLRVNNVRALRIEPNNFCPNLIGGFSANTVSGATTYGATIGGGGTSGKVNSVSGSCGTVSGGNNNTAGNAYATVGGGSDNTASGNSAAVGGGFTNTASGMSATVAGGDNNTAAGNWSFAAGRRAKADNQGSFVWGDSTNADVVSALNNQFVVRASGGIVLFSSADTAPPAPGLRLAAGDSAWTAISDRDAKKNFRPVDGEEVLGKVAAMPVTYWQYKWQPDDAVPLIGPVAQDLIGAFYPGADDKGISTQQADGVHFAAIKALETRTRELREENALLKSRIAKLEEAYEASRHKQ